jgi:succinate--hydroxymethylglutarate CoA-transferase
VGVAVIDLATGLSSVGAITAALYQREKSGKGMKIECSLLETQVSDGTDKSLKEAWSAIG